MKRYVLGVLKYLLQRKVSLCAIVDCSCEISTKASVYRGVKLVNSSVGDYSYISPNCEIVNTNIGKYTSIANGCAIGLGMHTSSYISMSPIFTEKSNGTGSSWIQKNSVDPLAFSVNIGNDVWIGARAIIIGNVTIGDGAIVGAGAVVTKDVPPYAIVGGVPAKVIKYRFDKVIIDKLVDLEWWNFTEEKLRNNIVLFQKEDVSINELEKLYNIN